jgi:hypothetical protein
VELPKLQRLPGRFALATPAWKPVMR